MEREPPEFTPEWAVKDLEKQTKVTVSAYQLSISRLAVQNQFSNFVVVLFFSYQLQLVIYLRFPCAISSSKIECGGSFLL